MVLIANIFQYLGDIDFESVMIGGGTNIIKHISEKQIIGAKLLICGKLSEDDNTERCEKIVLYYGDAAIGENDILESFPEHFLPVGRGTS